MAKRVDLIRQIEKHRKSRVISYITSDRPAPLSAQMSGDIVPWFYRQLREIKFSNKIDLFLYSSGGDTIVPWRLVCLIREFCSEFGVIIPYKSHSAATLLALGADEIIMGPLAELSPIDPLIGTPFNPSQAGNPNIKPPISVEDVVGYINLAKAKERFNVKKEDNLLRVLEKLSDTVHPLALGATHRSHALTRLLAENLLTQCRKEKYKPAEISKIIKTLAEKLYYHNYLMGRKEAFNLGLKVKNTDEKTENLIWDLYLEYEELMGLTKQFNPYEYFADAPQQQAGNINQSISNPVGPLPMQPGIPQNLINSIDKEFTISIIETCDLTCEGKHKLKLNRVPQPVPGSVPQIQVNSLGFKWEISNSKEGKDEIPKSSSGSA